MRFFYKYIPFLILFFNVLSVFGQAEKGKSIKTPKIPINKKNTTKEEQKKESEFDFIFEEQPKLRFSTDYEQNKNLENLPQTKEISGIKIEPLRELNETVSEDTSSLNDGMLLTIEVEEKAMFQGADSMVQVASHFSIWDTRNVNPYHIDPKTFNESIPIKLYDETEGRKWSVLLDKTVVTSRFGWRNRKWHKGTDLDLETGDPVYAAFDGIIRVAGVHSGWGNTVLIRHNNGLETLYGHLSRINFDPNTIVRAGDEIGRGGNTGRSSGSHLHYEVQYEGNAFDPEYIYNFADKKTALKSQEFLLTPDVYAYKTKGKHIKPKGSEGELSASSAGNVSFGVDALETLSSDLGEVEEEEDTEDEKPIYVEQVKWYVTRPGDNLTDIARHFHLSLGELCKLNKINPSKKLFVGLRLRVK